MKKVRGGAGRSYWQESMTVIKNIVCMYEVIEKYIKNIIESFFYGSPRAFLEGVVCTKSYAK